MFAINSQRVLACATCRAPDVVTGLIKLNLVEFFCFVVAQYFGELYLDTVYNNYIYFSFCKKFTD